MAKAHYIFAAMLGCAGAIVTWLLTDSLWLTPFCFLAVVAMVLLTLQITLRRTERKVQAAIAALGHIVRYRCNAIASTTAYGAAYTVICLTDDGIALIYEHQGVMQTIWHPKEELLRCTVGENGNALGLYLKNDRHYILRNFAAAELAQQMHTIGLL